MPKEIAMPKETPEEITCRIETDLSYALIDSRKHPGLSIGRVARVFKTNWVEEEIEALIKELQK